MVNGNLPDGWAWKDLEEICVPPQYGWTTKGLADGKLHLLRTTDITSGSINWDTVPFCAEEPSDREKYLLHDGDIVISRAGSVGYSHLIKNPKPAVFASYLIRFRPLINEKYIAFFLQSPAYWQAISEQSLGIAIPNVNASKLKKIRVPIAPENEQERIVAKIEELFTQLEAGTSALAKVQAGLRRYKASVLKAACEGKLLESREAQNNGELPDGWQWAQLGDLTEHITSGSRWWAKYYSDDGAIFIRAQDINTDKLVLKEVAFVNPPRDSAEALRTRVRKNDLLVTITGANVTKTAKVDVDLEEAYMSQHVALVRPRLSEISDYLYYWIISPAHGRKALEKLAYGAGKPGLNLTNLRELLVALPPLEEQRRIVAEVERRLSVAREVESVVEKALIRAARLRQSVLKSAFEGKLL